MVDDGHVEKDSVIEFELDGTVWRFADDKEGIVYIYVLVAIYERADLDKLQDKLF